MRTETRIHAATFLRQASRCFARGGSDASCGRGKRGDGFPMSMFLAVGSRAAASVSILTPPSMSPTPSNSWSLADGGAALKG
jgi:hypothetical protein